MAKEKNWPEEDMIQLSFVVSKTVFTVLFQKYKKEGKNLSFFAAVKYIKTHSKLSLAGILQNPIR